MQVRDLVLQFRSSLYKLRQIVRIVNYLQRSTMLQEALDVACTIHPVPDATYRVLIDKSLEWEQETSYVAPSTQALLRIEQSENSEGENFWTNM